MIPEAPIQNPKQAAARAIEHNQTKRKQDQKEQQTNCKTSKNLETTQAEVVHENLHSFTG
jgi:hypothetical protein